MQFISYNKKTLEFIGENCKNYPHIGVEMTVMYTVMVSVFFMFKINIVNI